MKPFKEITSYLNSRLTSSSTKRKYDQVYFLFFCPDKSAIYNRDTRQQKTPGRGFTEPVVLFRAVCGYFFLKNTFNQQKYIESEVTNLIENRSFNE